MTATNGMNDRQLETYHKLMEARESTEDDEVHQHINEAITALIEEVEE